MGAVNFSIDLGLVDALRKTLPLDVFVETGTFRGDTVELVKDRFGEIYTVELSPEYYEQAQARFRGQVHIHFFHGDSAAVLREIAPQLSAASALYFFDAHWCVAENAAGESSQCPLLEEIRAIGRLNANSLIVIDDARLFLAPPPAPHEISHWPSLSEVLEELRALSASHVVSVLNDNILFFPEVAETAVRNYGHAKGIDWLEVLHKTRDYENLQKQFVGLQRQFDDLQKQLEAKDVEIASLKTDCDTKDAEIASLKTDCDTKDAEIVSLKGVCEEREKAIFQLDARVRFLEKTNLIGLILVKARAAILVVAALLKAYLEKWARPRIGVLRQHSPRDLVLPPDYVATRAQTPLPPVSIVTPSFNQAIFLERTIQSVKNQSYGNLEYIVQDGGSSDGSVEVLDRFSDFLTHWQSAKDNGQTHAINLGFAHAHGEIMAYLNSDDILLPGALHYVADYFSKHPDVDVVYSHRVLIDANDQEIGRWILPPHNDKVLSWADFIPQETMFWRRRIWKKIGGSLDESFHFAMDWDLILRFRDAGAKFVRVPRFLGAFRIHPQQKTSAEIAESGFQEMNRLRERCLGRSVTDFEIRRAIAPYLLRHVLYDKLYGLVGYSR